MTSAAPGLQRVVVFDGICNFCNGWVRFLLRYDHAGLYQLAPMQGRTGAALLSEQGLDPRDPTSFLMLDAQGAHFSSSAILRVLVSLGGVWRLSAVFWLIPRPIRDLGYRTLARNRYRWFGRTEACPLPSPQHAARFLP